MATPSARARELAAPGAYSALSAYEKLTPHRRRFVDEYLESLNGWQAAIRAGLAGKTAYEMLRHPDIIGAIRERRALLDSERSIQGARFVLNKLWDTASADPRELVEILKVPCRYCWGNGGQYQFTKAEAHRRMQAHEAGLNDHPYEVLYPRGSAELAAWTAGKERLPLDPQGGDDYRTNREPNAACSECAGDGVTIQRIADTRKLTPGAKALYRGVKATKDGLEVLMADQAQARDMLAKHYGVAVERKRVLVRRLDPDELTDEELVASLEELESLHGQITEAEFEVIDEANGTESTKAPERPASRSAITTASTRTRERPAAAAASTIQAERKPRTNRAPSRRSTVKPKPVKAAKAAKESKYFKPVPGQRKQTRRWKRRPPGEPFTRPP